jgi:hypothetical protein
LFKALATLTSRRVMALYELMDGGYRGPRIRQYCEQLGHVVLTPDVPRPAEPELVEWQLGNRAARPRSAHNLAAGRYG